MGIAILQQLVANDDMIRETLWGHDGLKIDIDKLLGVTSKLQTQLEVQKVLLSTAKLLREHPSHKPLPNQQATRVKNFIKFIFESASHTQEKPKERQRRLQELDCTSLKLCGLSYTVREIIDMPSEQFEFIIDKVMNFTEIHKLSLQLCRDDINKIVHGDFKPEDETKFKAFLLSHVEARLAQQKSVGQDLMATAGPPRGKDDAAVVLPVNTQPRPEVDTSRKRTRREGYLEQSEEVTQASREPKYAYSYARVDETFHHNLGPLLSNAIKNSQQWKSERRNEENTTCCLTIWLPEGPNADVSVSLWVGQSEAFNLNSIFNLTPAWASDQGQNQIPSTKHARP